MKAIVVAVDRNNGIGADGDLLWQRDLPADLKRFKELTTGTSVVMGRKTYESIGRPLPGRQNIVVTRQAIEIPGIDIAHSLQEAYSLATHDTISIIGGSEIYTQSIDDIDVLYVTQVDAEFPAATVFFPHINCQEWQEVAREHFEADETNKYAFDFVEYRRV